MHMPHNLPSIKTLETIAFERARELRSVLELTKRSELEEVLASGKYPATDEWYRRCYHPMAFGTAKLSIADPAGSNAKSPAIEYVNAGDPYAATLMYVSGRGYKVGCWGDIVERGNYA